MINGLDVGAIVPTGSGKTLVVYLVALAIRHLYPASKSLVLVGLCILKFQPLGINYSTGMPLSMIIDDQLANSYCPVLTMSMAGQVMALDECGRPAPVSFEQVVSGEYLAMFAQPEGAATEAGQKVLRGLASRDQIRALFVDEVHQVSVLEIFLFLHQSYVQGLGGHWESIRPGLLRNIFSTRIHLAPGSPICFLTATITHQELDTVLGMFGSKRSPLVVAAGPILSHTKICTIRRPSSSVHFLGNHLPDGSFQPGDLQFLDTLVLDDFKKAVQQGSLEDFPKTIIFCRQVLKRRKIS